MNAKVDVLSVLDRLIGNARTTAGLTGDPRMRDNLRDGEQARVAVAELVEVAKRVRPFLRDEADKYLDDGSNEPLECLRDLDEALANIGSAK